MGDASVVLMPQRMKSARTLVDQNCDKFKNIAVLIKVLKMRTRSLLPTIFLSVLLAACGGGGGGTSSPTVSSTQIDLCAVESKNYGDVPIPTGYLGSYQVPSAAGRLANSVVRTADLADWDYWWSRPATLLCTDKIAYLKNINRETIRRLAAIGVNRIYVSNYGSWDNIANPIWHIPEANYAIPKAVLEFTVAEAHARGMQVFLTWQNNYSDDAHGFMAYDAENLSQSQYTALKNSWRSHILEQAAYAQSIGLDGLGVGIDYFDPLSVRNVYTPPGSTPNGGQLKTDYSAFLVQLAGDVRSVFAGKLYYGGQNDDVYPNVIAAVDEFVYRLWAGATAGTYNTGNPFNVQNLKGNLQQGFYYAFWRGGVDFGNGGSISKPVVFKTYAQSTTDFYNGGSWIEDNWCIEPCAAQRSLTTSFSAQAVAYEAALELANEQTYVTTGGVGPYGYAYFDLLSETRTANSITFPNISNSIRNKPAEAIVRDWFRRQ
jgi:hypothetical protein